jgi:hypothetical protein
MRRRKRSVHVLSMRTLSAAAQLGRKGGTKTRRVYEPNEWEGSPPQADRVWMTPSQKVEVFAPIPSASVNTATALTPSPLRSHLQAHLDLADSLSLPGSRRSACCVIIPFITCLSEMILEAGFWPTS